MSWLSFGKSEVLEETGLELSPPWIEHARKIYALFSKDPEITIQYDEAVPEVKLYVADQVKAEALGQLLPAGKSFGNVELSITVVPPNKASKPKLMEAAFAGNPIFSEIVYVEGAYSNPITYVVFENEIAQYFNDDLGTVDGVKSALYETIAPEVLETGDGMLFCTKTYEDGKIVWP